MKIFNFYISSLLALHFLILSACTTIAPAPPKHFVKLMGPKARARRELLKRYRLQRQKRIKYLNSQLTKIQVRKNGLRNIPNIKSQRSQSRPLPFKTQTSKITEKSFRLSIPKKYEVSLLEQKIEISQVSDYFCIKNRLENEKCYNKITLKTKQCYSDYLMGDLRLTSCITRSLRSF